MLGGKDNINMKRAWIGLALGCLMLVCCGGCISFPNVKPEPWPAESSNRIFNFVAEKMDSTDQAIGTIKNLQTVFVEFSSGIHISSLEVDAFGMRAKWEWIETAQNTQYVPSSGGFFVGWNYVPTYGGS
ncbi:MAG: hypothetical protein ABSE90_09910, partial [Verrucomicrobiota bacterium]